ncbi:MAG: hypothetical protein Q9222_005772 [Ikaeria aurantiellina]
MKRFFDRSSAVALDDKDVPNQLLLSLRRIVEGYPPQDQYPRRELRGLYSGPTSIAYLFLQLSHTHPDLIIDGHHCKSWCNAYLKGNREFGHINADNCGVINEPLAYYAVLAATTGDLRHVDSLCFAISSVTREKNGSDEWLYGRAGLLYLLRLVRRWVPSCGQATEAYMQDISDRIIENGPHWKWHGKEYLGAVHGSVGIVTQLILSDPDTAKHENVRATVLDLLDRQDEENGNFPSSIESGKTSLVQVCHGAPGFTLSLPLIRPVFDAVTQSLIDHAVAKARGCIWDMGLLTKEPCLCHGVTGNAVALTGSQRHHFMAYTTAEMILKGKGDGIYLEGSDPYGLFCGEAGRAWGWAVLDDHKDLGLIGYSDI